MFWSVRVGSVYGIPFRLDITFLLILPVFAALLGFQIEEVATIFATEFGTDIDPDVLAGGATPWILGFVAAVALFACVTLHEFGHAVAARRYGYEVESITLWLLGGVASFEELPRNWVHEFTIAVAGPLVNLGIVAICGTVIAFVPLGDILLFLILYLALLNIILATFNMLPAFPLDGGRVLRAVLARNKSYVRATREAAAIGKGFAFILGLVGLLYFNPILVAIALFIYIAAGSETRQMLLDAAFDGVRVESIMTPVEQLDTVQNHLSLSAVLDEMLDHRHIGYPVLDGETLVGLVTLDDVKSRQPDDESVADVMTPRADLETITPSTAVMDAFRTVSKSDVGRLPVVTEDGDLVGLVTRTDLMRAFKIVTERQRYHESVPGGRDQGPVQTVDVEEAETESERML